MWGISKEFGCWEPWVGIIWLKFIDTQSNAFASASSSITAPYAVLTIVTPILHFGKLPCWNNVMCIGLIGGRQNLTLNHGQYMIFSPKVGWKLIFKCRSRLVTSDAASSSSKLTYCAPRSRPSGSRLLLWYWILIPNASAFLFKFHPMLPMPKIPINFPSGSSPNGMLLRNHSPWR